MFRIACEFFLEMGRASYTRNLTVENCARHLGTNGGSGRLTATIHVMELTMADNGTTKETTVVTTGGGGGGSWFLIGALVVIVAIGGYFFFGGEAPVADKNVDVSIELPKSE
ncbi:hypothetical protein [Roseivivax sp. CAU 1753]